MDNESNDPANPIIPTQPFVGSGFQVNQTPSVNNPQVKTTNSKVAALVILAVGLLALVGGYFIVQRSSVPKSYIITHGLVKSSFPGPSGSYDIQIDFTAQDNKQYSFTSRVPSQFALHNSNYFVGENTVKVAYNPQNPAVDPKNASDKSTPVYGTIIEVVGGVFAIIGLISLVQQLLTKR